MRRNNNDRARKTVAQEAARIIVTQGIRDFRVAKTKAAERLGLVSRGSLPGNSEVERAIDDYHQIFGGLSHVALLNSLRQSALAAMRLLEQFSPRLVGAVLNGTADENSVISLHVFDDSAESLALYLADQQIPCRPYERRLKRRKDQVDTFAGFEFDFADATIQATVFPENGIRQAPLSPIDGRPMQRADAKAVARLL
ncbi:MAG TPA: hypothetical protein PKK10_16085 [Woeseiaceae bacterium]|nr:hypothetical protein [Woeseiaceae bacterium]